MKLILKSLYNEITIEQKKRILKEYNKIIDRFEYVANVQSKDTSLIRQAQKKISDNQYNKDSKVQKKIKELESEIQKLKNLQNKNGKEAQKYVSELKMKLKTDKESVFIDLNQSIATYNKKSWGLESEINAQEDLVKNSINALQKSADLPW